MTCLVTQRICLQAWQSAIRRIMKIISILPIKRYNTQSALNNFEEYTMLSPAQLAPYFGFTETEVRVLCERNGMDVLEMKHWYDGYQLGNVKSIYNPYAVMRALKRKIFESCCFGTEI